MIRIAKIALIAFILIGGAIPQAGCGAEPTGAEALAQESRLATVQRGNLRVEITAAGNLALSRTEDIPFDLFYSKGTVAEVLVKEGDSVEEGQALAKVDLEEWDDEMSTLEKKLSTAQRNLTDKESTVIKAERQVTALERKVSDKEIAVTEAERQVVAKELAVSQAQLDLETAEYNLSQIEEVKKAQDAIDKAESNLKLAVMGLTGAFGGGLADFTYWSNLKTKAEEELAQARQDLQDILEDKDITLSRDVALEVAEKQLKVKQKQLTLEDAKKAVEDAKKAVEDAKYDVEYAKYDVEYARLAVEDARHDVEDARKTLADAQKALDRANSKSAVLVAPFAGFITKVNVEGGDEVMTGTVAVQLADPNRFEADIMVNEMDISQVKIGGQAWVQVNALSGLNLPAEITHISPTATIQSGVVNYRVKVELKPLEEVRQQQQATHKETEQKIEPGELPERLKQAVEEGRLTLEQAQRMMAQRQGGPPSAPVSLAIPKDFQLREGLTVTVNILVAERQNVLLVPNNAIIRQGNQTYVQVWHNGVTEKRVIETGISDWQYTEAVSGLSEGEQVIVPQKTTTTTTRQSSFRGPIPFMGPPPGR